MRVLILFASLWSSAALASPEVQSGDIFIVEAQGEYTQFNLAVEKVGWNYKILQVYLRQQGVFNDFARWTSEGWIAGTLGSLGFIGVRSTEGNDLFRFPRFRMLTFNFGEDRAWIGRTPLNIFGPIGYRLSYKRLPPEEQRAIRLKLAREGESRRIETWVDGKNHYSTPESRKLVEEAAQALVPAAREMPQIDRQTVGIKAYEFVVNNAHDLKSEVIHPYPVTETHRVVIGESFDNYYLLSITVTKPDRKSYSVDLGTVRGFTRTEQLVYQYEIAERHIVQHYEIDTRGNVRIGLKGSNGPSNFQWQHGNYKRLELDDTVFNNAVAIKPGKDPFVTFASCGLE